MVERSPPKTSIPPSQLPQPPFTPAVTIRPLRFSSYATPATLRYDNQHFDASQFSPSSEAGSLQVPISRLEENKLARQEEEDEDWNPLMPNFVKKAIKGSPFWKPKSETTKGKLNGHHRMVVSLYKHGSTADQQGTSPASARSHERFGKSSSVQDGSNPFQDIEADFRDKILQNMYGNPLYAGDDDNERQKCTGCRE
eukprot:CAMPEP_0198226982 /NCGR_PEP_ID=MMETSP1445-20131203/107413_1 /TAXON_ID=36898 /ORGANISM="Pyramimonas sp., Strain CCMP2087" /LENGTH=196 /DNA_ID=CAMNT_0043906925 /DNA_START=477 /DNA_END=1067 /DNA_ORIENTATION=-